MTKFERLLLLFSLVFVGLSGYSIFFANGVRQSCEKMRADVREANGTPLRVEVQYVFPEKGK